MFFQNIYSYFYSALSYNQIIKFIRNSINGISQAKVYQWPLHTSKVESFTAIVYGKVLSQIAASEEFVWILDTSPKDYT